jgi:hypothetical protein
MGCGLLLGNHVSGSTLTTTIEPRPVAPVAQAAAEAGHRAFCQAMLSCGNAQVIIAAYFVLDGI